MEKKLKILLINPVARAWAKPNCIPLGLGYIASVLRYANHEVDLLDLNAYRDDKDSVFPQEKYDIIGLTGIVTQYKEVKRIASRCKSLYPEIPIVCGGSLATSIPGLLLSKTGVDSCIIGEGEEVIFDLLNDLFNTGNIAAMYYSDSVLIKNISSIPWPAYDLFSMETYINNPIAADNLKKWEDGGWITSPRRSLNIIGSRGCIAKCIYCFHCYMGQGWRARSTGDILGEMGMLKDKYKIDYVHFVDDAFACSKNKIMDFCNGKMLSNLSSVKWSCAGRANIVDEEMISTMAESGCEGICYGLESGSQKILDIMHKKITVGQYEKAIALNKKYFTYQDYTFIVGTPGETDKTIDESIEFCKRNEIAPSAVFYMTPYPGTQLFKNLLDNDDNFFEIWKNKDLFEEWILKLEEQGEQMIWNCSGAPDDKIYEWHSKFQEETGAWNKYRH